MAEAVMGGDVMGGAVIGGDVMGGGSMGVRRIVWRADWSNDLSIGPLAY